MRLPAQRLASALLDHPRVARALFGVTPAGPVNLDPVTLALRAVAGPFADRAPRTVELGAGPGAVIAGWLARRTGRPVEAVELDPSVAARARAATRGLAVAVVEGDGPGAVAGPVDLWVANPPYLPSATGAALALERFGVAPRAWDGGPDGTAVVAAWMAAAAPRSAPGATFLFGVGARWVEAEAVERAVAAGPWRVHRRWRLGPARLWALTRR